MSLALSRGRGATAALLVLLAACGGEPASAGRDTGAAATSPASTGSSPSVPTVTQLVDSSLRAFRRELSPVDRLATGDTSRESLVRRFVAAAQQRDTAALGAMLVSRAEFAWLYFPETRISRPPYGIDPGFLWLQMGSNTDRDLPKASAALAGGASYVAHVCADSVVVEGANRVHEQCLVVVQQRGGRDTLSLFGSILERGGRFKFLSYANRL